VKATSFLGLDWFGGEEQKNDHSNRLTRIEQMAAAAQDLRAQAEEVEDPDEKLGLKKLAKDKEKMVEHMRQVDNAARTRATQAREALKSSAVDEYAELRTADDVPLTLVSQRARARKETSRAPSLASATQFNEDAEEEVDVGADVGAEEEVDVGAEEGAEEEVDVGAEVGAAELSAASEAEMHKLRIERLGETMRDLNSLRARAQKAEDNEERQMLLKQASFKQKTAAHINSVDVEARKRAKMTIEEMRAKKFDTIADLREIGLATVSDDVGEAY